MEQQKGGTDTFFLSNPAFLFPLIIYLIFTHHGIHVFLFCKSTSIFWNWMFLHLFQTEFFFEFVSKYSLLEFSNGTEDQLEERGLVQYCKFGNFRRWECVLRDRRKLILLFLNYFSIRDGSYLLIINRQSKKKLIFYFQFWPCPWETCSFTPL